MDWIGKENSLTYSNIGVESKVLLFCQCYAAIKFCLGFFFYFKKIFGKCRIMLMQQYSPNHSVSSFHFCSKWMHSERLMLISCLLFTLGKFLVKEDFSAWSLGRCLWTFGYFLIPLRNSSWKKSQQNNNKK